MPIKVPLSVNGRDVGIMEISRQIEGVPEANLRESWRTFAYLWEARVIEHGSVARDSGLVHHCPNDGIWALVGKAMAAVGPHMRRCL